MRFRSILFGGSDAGDETRPPSEPRFFRDLNLDQVVDAVTARRDEYDLKPFFFGWSGQIDTVLYRQEVFRDLERPDVHALASAFAEAKLVAQFTYRVRELQDDDRGLAHYHRERSFLNAVRQYCDAVMRLASGLASAELGSRGLIGLSDFLASYVASPAFRAMQSETDGLERELDAVRYALWITGDRITVGRFDGEADYSEQVARTFARFRQVADATTLAAAPDWETYASAGVLDLVARLYPRLFGALEAFCANHRAYLDPTLAAVDRELQFYLAFLGYVAPLRKAGLCLSYPRVSVSNKAEQALDTFDLALAALLTAEGNRVVTNDVTLARSERILVISGPNNGGKTTLARTVGQLHYLAQLGCPVPGRDVQLFLCDQIFTHFEKAETIATLAGKLQDELNRMAADFEQATSSSLFVLNEVFNSTTAQDALFLSRQILGRVSDLDALCVCVTFLDELATLNAKTVSMVSMVVPDDPAIRTFKLVRRRADGRAYARAIAEKYGLTFERLTAERPQ